MHKHSIPVISVPVRMSDRPDNRMDEFDDLVELLMDHRCDDETETHRNETEPYNQPERVVDRPNQVGNL